jgi:hypothetical protein
MQTDRGKEIEKMSDKKHHGNITFFVVAGLLVGMILSGCFASSGGVEKWREQVQLSDGRIIVIERETLRVGGGGSITHRVGSSPKEHLLRFPHPDKPEVKIEWRSTKVDDDFGTIPEFPLVLDLEAGSPIVLTLVGRGKGAAVLYSKYVYQEGNWQEEELPEIFPERKSNLYLGVGIDMPGLVSIDKKQRAYKSIDFSKKYKLVGPQREKINY